MSVTSTLKRIVDTPVWEWTRFAPVTTATVSCMSSGDNPSDNRYLYYINVSALYRYDTWTDSWAQLASTNTAPATMVAMRYSSYDGGYRGRIISSTGTTITMSALRGSILSGQTIRIYSGTGANQSKTIVSTTDATVYDSGVVTATTNANQIQDTTKKWKWNQWSGYQCGVIFGGGGVTQRRKILYNDSTTLYFSDPNYQQIDPWNNTGFSNIAPYTIPISTAGSQSYYVIEASTITIDSPWTVQPDNASRFSVQSGGLWVLSTTASAPYYTMQFYDVLTDAWYTRTAVQGLLPAAITTDITFEKISNTAGKFVSSQVTSTTTRTLVDTNLSGLTSGFTTLIDRFINYQIRIVGGAGIGQRRRIVSNNTTTFWVNRKWDVALDNTSLYEVWDDSYSAYLGGMAFSSMFNYHVESDLMCQGSVSDWGLARNLSIRVNGWEDIGISSAVRNTNGILTVNTIPVSAGSGYVVGEIVTLGTGTNGKVYIESVYTGGTVATVSLMATGSGYSVATASQSATTGSGTGLQIGVISVGVVGRITTAVGLNHFFKIGDSLTFNGAVESLWNVSGYTVLGVDSLTTLDIAITATGTAVAANSNSTAVMVDCSANWDSNEHVGKLVQIMVAGASPTSQIRRITANGQTTLTLQSAITQAVNGTSRYVIYDPSMIGRDEQYKYLGSQKGNTGWATSGGTTTLIDSTKNWYSNQWFSYKFRIIAGTGFGNEIVVTSNTSNSLMYTTQTFVPDATTKYLIMDTFGLVSSGSTTALLNDYNKNWVVNQWSGKRCKITSGTGVGQEFTITSNTYNQLSFTAITTGPSIDSTYTILGIPQRGAGIELLHLDGTSNLSIKGKYLFFPRGGTSTTADRLDLNYETWEYGYFFSPQSETLTTGTMWAYDGGDIIYFQKDATGRVYAYDIRTNKISNSSTIPYGQGSTLIGNRFEIIQTDDGLKYMYMMRHSGQEMFRCLIFW